MLLQHGRVVAMCMALLQGVLQHHRRVVAMCMACCCMLMVVAMVVAMRMACCCMLIALMSACRENG
jgi:hypothetical protein